MKFGEEKIIVRFTADFPRLFGNMEKYIPLINHKLGSETQNKFYMESISNGLVYVYSDFATFELMNRPYKSEKIQSFKECHELELNPLLLTDNIITSVNFPKTGICFQYKIVAPDSELIINHLITHFRSFLGDQVEPEIQEDFDLVLRLKSFECIALYTNLAASMYSGILSEQLDD